MKELRGTMNSQKENILPSTVSELSPSSLEEDINPHIKFFTETVLSGVFPDTKLKSKRQRQIIEILTKHSSITSLLAGARKSTKQITTLQYDLKMS